jgi:hypothetical protein
MTGESVFLHDVCHFKFRDISLWCVSKKQGKSLRFLSKGMTLFNVMYRQISEYETIIKAQGNADPFVHIGLVQKALGFEPHLTNEKEPNRLKAHKYFRLYTSEEFLNSYLTLVSRPGSTPPKITSVSNQQEMRTMTLWTKVNASKLIHPPNTER